jgi:hypothetical protein
MDPKAGLDVAAKRKVFTPAGIGTLATKPVARPYIDGAIPTPEKK